MKNKTVDPAIQQTLSDRSYMSSLECSLHTEDDVNAALVATAMNRLALSQSQPNDTFGVDSLLETRADLARLHKAAMNFLRAQTDINSEELTNLLNELTTKY